MTHILDPKENETVCDPTCGSGGFLIKAFEYMREKIEEDVKKAGITSISTIELKFNFKYFDDVKVQFTRNYTE